MDRKFFRELRQNLNALREAEEKELKAEAQEGADKAERRLKAKLAALPLDRHCPGCKKIILKNRSWVVLADNTAVCLGCYRKHPDKYTARVNRERDFLAAEDDLHCDVCDKDILDVRSWVKSADMCRSCFTKRSHRIRKQR